MNRMRLQKPRKTFPAASILLILLIAASFLLTAVLYNHTGTSSHNKAEYYAGPVTEQAVLLISPEDSPSSSRYANLRTAFANAGISSLFLQISSDQALTEIEQIEQAMDRLERLSGRQPAHQWILAEGNAAAILAENAGKIPSAGLVFLYPIDLDFIPAAVWTNYPKELPTIILTGLDEPAADQAIRLFEQQTGEDARLFKGASAPGWFQATQYRSVDGRFVLLRYPLLRRHLSPHDIRIAADLSGELTAYDPATAEKINSISAMAALSQVFFLRYILLMGLIILALPVVYAMALRKKTAALMILTRPGCFFLRKSWVCGLSWLPAIALCVSLVLMINQWIFTWKSPWTGILFFLPGSYGLISWISRLVAQQRPADKIDLPGQPVSTPAAAEKPVIYAAVLVYTLIVVIFLVWRWLMFGWYSDLQFSPLVMLLFFVWNIPGIWPDQQSTSDKTLNKRSSLLSVWFFCCRCWPYLVLLILVPILIDGAAFIILGLILAFLYWSDLAGRTITVITGRCWIGRLVRSLLLTLSWFHPALLPSVFY